MYLPLLYIVLTILWIIIGSSYIKWHPFLVLLIGSFLLALLVGTPIVNTFEQIGSGFYKIVKSIGLLILFGTIIGAALEQSKGTLSLAGGILKHLSRLPLPYAISCIGYLVSIPVFCDAAFVILSQLNKTLSRQTKTPLVGLAVALSTGLFAPHVLVPPTPGPLAAAANLNLNNLLLLIVIGGSIAFILILVGGAYGNYLSKKMEYIPEGESETLDDGTEITALPSFKKALLPIALPILLMCLGTIPPTSAMPQTMVQMLKALTQPTTALFVGMLFALGLDFRKKGFVRASFQEGVKKTFPILLITGMGGALGAIIQTLPLVEYAKALTQMEGLGILIAFLIAALLKTAQGSSTVAIITTSSILFPLLPLLGLDSEMGKIWAIMALGVGSMTVSHANDSYFWIVSQMSGMDVKTAYRTHTFGTFIQGMVGLLVVLIGYTLWQLF